MSTAPPGPSTQAVMARGAGKALLGRAGAVIELLSFFLFTQMYGSQTFGLFMTLWGVVQGLAIVSDFGMTMALQRFVPGAPNEAEAGRVLKYAVNTTLSVSCLVGIAMAASAPLLARVINANAQDSQHLLTIIRLYAFAVPLWSAVEVATGAIRARAVFGPEVKVRIFYEQGFRLLFGVLFWWLGFLSLGLFISHLIGLAVTAAFALRLVNKYYGLRHLVTKTGLGGGLGREMVFYSSSMLLPNFAKKWHSWLPVIFLNMMLPGARGAEAAGVYAAARKLVSVLNVFRESFEYVLAPMTAARSDLHQREQLREMLAFATRVSVAAFIPVATLVVCYRHELLRQSGSEFVAGAGAMLILVIGRSLEVVSGPSTSILAMIGRYRIPFFNAAAGVTTTAVLAFLLIPMPELFGGGLRGSMAAAALAAAGGINMTALMGFLQVRYVYGLRPYDRRLARPVATALALSAGMVALFHFTAGMWRTGYFILGIVTLLIVLGALIRFGFAREDAQLVVPKKLARHLPFLLRR
ncbi:MAG: oligosaccharide flippase family protein [Alphaproteobacteria bacterium]|nr:oligosaccharide flippase family protein [Alphaproteobacteria bacterium]